MKLTACFRDDKVDSAFIVNDVGVKAVKTTYSLGKFSPVGTRTVNKERDSCRTSSVGRTINDELSTRLESEVSGCINRIDTSCSECEVEAGARAKKNRSSI